MTISVQASCLPLALLAIPSILSPDHAFANAAPVEHELEACPRHAPLVVDVAVVGGGFSGMASAYALHQAGLKTVVLEAHDKLGGRSRTHQLQSGPGVIELGATWINNLTQPEVFALTEEFGLHTIEQYTEGIDVTQLVDGSVDRGEGTGEPSPEVVEALELQDRLIAAMIEAIEKIDITVFDQFDPEDDVSFAEWIAKRGLYDHPHIQGVCRQLSSVIVGREPREIGAHYFFDYIKSGRGLDSLLTEGQFGAQSLMIKEGTTAIVTSIADRLPAGSVFLNSPVTQIEQREAGVLVTTGHGKRIHARKVVVATIPTVYGNIDFTPELPADKQGLATESLPGIYAKIVLTYSEPWWREAGMVGKFSSMVGPVSFSWDASVPELDQYSLPLFIAGDFASEWYELPDSEKVNAMVEGLATLVGEDLADRARDTLEVNYAEWTREEYIGAGPTAAMGPGALRKYGNALRAPFQHIHFAGTETAFEWKGYLEGAVTAGQRAAQEIIEALR